MSVAFRFLSIDGREPSSAAAPIQQLFHVAATYLNPSAVRDLAPHVANCRNVSATTSIRFILQHPIRSRTAQTVNEIGNSSRQAVSDMTAAFDHAIADQAATVATELVMPVGATAGLSINPKPGGTYD
jgi:hypothetical protein